MIKNLKIRPMQLRDIDQVKAIEDQSFDCSWTKKEFHENLTTPHVYGRVAVLGDEVVGYAVFETVLKEGLCIMNIAVAKEHRRRGIGSRLLKALKGKLSKARCWISCHVRESNLPAHLFFRSSGFLATKVLRGFYDNSAEDAYEFEYTASKQQSSDVMCA